MHQIEVVVFFILLHLEIIYLFFGAIKVAKYTCLKPHM
jgi:hypothetical protein